MFADICNARKKNLDFEQVNQNLLYILIHSLVIKLKILNISQIHRNFLVIIPCVLKRTGRKDMFS